MSSKKLWHEINDPKLRNSLARWEEKLQDSLAVSIGKAAEIIQATPAQLRYWELQGIVRPKMEEEGQSRRVREYNIVDLKRLILATELAEHSGYSPAQIARMFDGLADQDEEVYRLFSTVASPSIEEELHTVGSSSVMLAHFLIPRLIELIFGLLGVNETNIGIIMPLDSASASLWETFLEEGQDLREAFPLLGDYIVGWLDEKGIVYVFVKRYIYLSQLRNYRFEMLPLLTNQSSLPDIPTKSVLLAFHEASEFSVPKDVNSAKGDGAIIAALVGVAIQQVRHIRAEISSSLYSLRITSRYYPDARLNDIANLITQVIRPADFCCILAPPAGTEQRPRRQHSLVIQGKSDNSPLEYEIGVTTLYPDEGLAQFVYQTSQIANVPDLTSDSRVAYLETEIKYGMKSAIAVPTGVNGSSNAVIYVASKHPNAFEGIHERVLSLLGYPVGKMVERENLIRMKARALTYSLDNPRVTDPLFMSFGTHDAFLRALESTIEEIIETRKIGTLSVLVVDVDSSNRIGELYGDGVMRSAWHLVGEKVRDHVKELVGIESLEVSRTLYDRYAIILEQFSLEDTFEVAESVKKSIETAPISVQWNGSEVTHPVTVRVAIISHKHEYLRNLGVSRHKIVELITKQINLALNFAKKSGGSSICYWDQDAEEFKIRKEDRVSA